MASLAEMLVQAEVAYHRLQTGAAVVDVVDANGERVRYAQADRRSLQSYVADLRRQIAGFSQSSTFHFSTRKGV